MVAADQGNIAGLIKRHKDFHHNLLLVQKVSHLIAVANRHGLRATGRMAAINHANGAAAALKAQRVSYAVQRGGKNVLATDRQGR